MIASKFLNDNAEDEVFNEDWAHAAEIEIKEINRIEREFLQAIVNYSPYILYINNYIRFFHSHLHGYYFIFRIGKYLLATMYFGRN